MTAWVLIGVIVCCSPLVGVIASRGSGRQAMDTWASALGVIGALALVIAVGVDGPVSGFDGWVVFDRAAAAWIAFALAVVWAIRSFAHRQLAADPLRGRFAFWSAVAATAGAGLFVAGNLVALLVAVVLSSVAAAGLVGAHLQGPEVRRRVLRTLLAGDLALAVGLGAVMIDARTVDASSMSTVDGPIVHLAASAIVVAALIRCAQLPAQQWLVRTLAAPTPASAMLHAGLVNAGGVILIRTAPLASRSTVAIVMGLMVVTASMVVAMAIMRLRSEVKTSLVWSTIAQMGFMVAQALVGLGAAAAAHLIAHGAYKAHLFLASGSTIEHQPVRPRAASSAERAMALVLGVAAVALATTASGYDATAQDGAAVLLPIFAAATVVTVLAGPVGLSVARPRRSAILVLAMGATSFVYLALLWRFEKWLELPELTPDGALAMVIVVSVLTIGGALATDRFARIGHVAAVAARARIVALSRLPVDEPHGAPAATGAA